MPELSVIVPLYNEVKTIKEILEKINSVGIDKEIIVVDDGSTDGSDRVLGEVKFDNLKIIHHTSNHGKGAAFITGLAHAAGKFVIIQDGDLECEPSDYIKLLNVIKEDRVDLVLGARFMKSYHGAYLHRIGNMFLTSIINVLYNAKLNDYATCYKLALRETFISLGLESNGFIIDVEIVVKALNKKMQIKDVPISYEPRTYSEGKKIRWKDGIQALLSIIKYRFQRR